MRDALVLFSKVCAVTMWNLTVQLTKDGRVRGLWIFFEDESKERIDSNVRRFDQKFERFVTELINAKVLPDNDKKRLFELRMALRNSFDSEFRLGYEPQGALMEWPAALKFYEAMGKEIKKARARGDLPKERGAA